MSPVPYLVLNRLAEHHGATFGEILYGEGNFRCYTLELTWKDNRVCESCIPGGTYRVRKRGKKWQFVDVPGRTAIQIHSGNTTKDTTGCILPGLFFGTLDDEVAVLDSREALRRLNEALEGHKEFDLEIRNLHF